MEEMEFVELLVASPLARVIRLSKTAEVSEMRRVVEGVPLTLRHAIRSADYTAAVNERAKSLQTDVFRMSSSLPAEDRHKDPLTRIVKWFLLKTKEQEPHLPALQWAQDARLRGGALSQMTAPESGKEHVFHEWLGRFHQNQNQRLATFRTNLLAVYQHHAFLSRHMTDGAWFLAKQAELSAQVKELGIPEKIQQLRTTRHLDKDALSQEFERLSKTIPSMDPTVNEIVDRYDQLTRHLNEIRNQQWYSHHPDRLKPHQAFLGHADDLVGLELAKSFTDLEWQTLYGDIPPLFRQEEDPLVRIPYDLTNPNPFGRQLLTGDRLEKWTAFQASSAFRGGGGGSV